MGHYNTRVLIGYMENNFNCWSRNMYDISWYTD